MRIHWHNIIALILVIIAIVLFFKCWPEMTDTLATMKHLGPGHTVEDKTFGLLALGLIGAILVAVVKILTSGRN